MLRSVDSKKATGLFLNSCIAINVGVQHNGEFLPGIIVYCCDPMLLPSGNPFKCHEEILYFQPMIPPKRYEIPPP